VDSSPSETGDLVPLVPLEEGAETALSSGLRDEVLPELVVRQWWTKAGAQDCGLSVNEFAAVLGAIGAKVNHGLPPGISAKSKQKVHFFESLHLSELALAHACALGRESAWKKFLQLYRLPLIQAAAGITNSGSLGEELVDALYAELYGLREREGERVSPLASYSGRGSLLSWLRTTLVQRYRDHHRRTRREEPIDGIDCPAPEEAASAPEKLNVLKDGLEQTIHELGAEDRFLLAAYFLDHQTLLQIARTLNVHEATISRRIKRLTRDLHDSLIVELQRRGLSRVAAQESLGADPRDIEINLRALLQTSGPQPFSIQGSGAQYQESDAP
jgi:RNA polymerase sigma-70 factor (ECF subfamily)